MDTEIIMSLRGMNMEQEGDKMTGEMGLMDMGGPLKVMVCMSSVKQMVGNNGKWVW